MKQFTIPKRSTDTIDFQLGEDDITYTFVPPKIAGPILAIAESDAGELAANREIMNWLSDGLPDEQSERIFERLTDPEDDLDIDTVGEVTRWLMEKVSDRPTVRR